MDVLCFLVLYALFGEIIGATFYISKTATNWTAASKQCNLAVPELVNSGNKITVSIADEIDLENEGVWVGYYQENVILEYFGCVKKNNHNLVLSTSGNPRQCITACVPQKIIGMFGNQCFCFGNDEDIARNIMHPFCNTTCDGIACGGSNGSASYVSLYRSIKIDGTHPKIGNGNGRCMYYDNTDGLNWTVCNTSYAIICENGSDVWIAQKENRQPFYGDWTESTTKCFQSNARPASNYTSIKTTQKQFQQWTGIVRRQTIRKYTESTNDRRYATKYGYLKRESGSYVLHFADLKTDTKRSLCANDAVINESSSVAATVVGIIVSIVVVAAIVIAIVVFARKRGVQLPFLKIEKQIHNQGTINKNVISGPVEIQHNSYDTSPNEYAEINSTTWKQSGAQDDVVDTAPKLSDYAHDYFVLEKNDEEPYNTTKPEIQKSDPNTFNPYNKLRLEKGSNYDHVGNVNTRDGISGRANPETENTYNTTSLGNSRLKASTGVANNQIEDTDDAYNHINFPLKKTGPRVPANDYDAM